GQHPTPTIFPYTTLFRSDAAAGGGRTMMEHVADVADLEPGEALSLELDGPDGSPLPVALVRDEDGEFHALSDICSHGQVNLSDGEVDGSTRECWLHGSTFDLRTGRPTGDRKSTRLNSSHVK